MHGPRNPKIADDTAFQTDKRCRKIVNIKSGCITLRIVSGIGTKKAGGITGNSERLRIADGIQYYVERITTDITECADSTCFLLNKCTAGNAAAAPASSCSPGAAAPE